MQTLKVFLDSAAWICEANLVGTARLYRYVLENHHEISNDPSNADVIIINSCGLTKMRRELSISYFQKYHEQKKAHAQIIMFGCLAKIEQSRLLSLELTPIDFKEGYKLDELLCNGKRFDDVHPQCSPQIQDKLLQGKTLFRSTRIYPFILSGVFFPFLKKMRVNYRTFIESFTYSNKIFVEIAQGCTGNCSYCMIKKARGNIHSRPIPEILDDVEELYNPTMHLFLVADDCGSYGLDIKTSLFELLKKINTRFPSITIDLNYLNPSWLERHPEEYIALFKNVNIRLASIPVQSGSNRVIAAMNRRYHIEVIADIINKIKQISPTTIVYTHFMIGFPGETTGDFLRTLYHTKSFDLPVGLIYSEHENSTCSKQGRTLRDLVKVFRYIVFLAYINIILSYKLLTFPSEKLHKASPDKT